MTIREFEALLALCKAAPLLKDLESAKKLLTQLLPYLSEAHTQCFAPSPFLQDVQPSPWEVLTHQVSIAALSIGLNHSQLHDIVRDRLAYYLERCRHTIASIHTNRPLSSDGDASESSDDAFDIAAIAVSLMGFLDAAATHANFWSETERLQTLSEIRTILSDEFLISVEGSLSSIRNARSSRGSGSTLKDWKRYARHYASSGRPLGGMLLQRGFMRLLVASTAVMVTDVTLLRRAHVLDVLMLETGPLKRDMPESDSGEEFYTFVDTLVDVLSAQMALLEDGADFLQLGSAWQQRLAFAAKAYVLMAYMNCVILDDDLASPDILMTWLEDTLTDPLQMTDNTLAEAVLKCMALLARLSPPYASEASRLLPRFIVQGGPRGPTIGVAARCLAYVLRQLSQDAVISTLYTLGNVLSSRNATERVLGDGQSPNGTLTASRNVTPYNHQPLGSAISLSLNDEEETSVVYGNVVEAIVGVARACADDKITALAQSMLIQKIGKISTAVDARIIKETASLATAGASTEFRSILRLYAKVGHDSVLNDDSTTSHAILHARNHLSTSLTRESPLFDAYLEHLLEMIVIKGDVQEHDDRRHGSTDIAAQEISQLLHPLALLVSANTIGQDDDLSDNVQRLWREAWFNIVVHGFTATSKLGRQYRLDLQAIAVHSRPLISEQGAVQLESDIELNAVLRRGMSSHHAIEQRKILSSILPDREADLRSLSYPKIIFLRATYLLESLRADAGVCTIILSYFLDPSLSVGGMGSCMAAVCDQVMNLYVRKALAATHQNFSASHIATQLAGLLVGCCHRSWKVQQVAAGCADTLLRDIPSALCQKSSLFALLELLSIMWTSCLEAETDEYGWKSRFSSTRAQISVELSDDYALRRATLDALYQRAKGWMMRVMNIAPLDVKGLLQTYLSEYDDDGAYGHVSLGRSFAVEMGSLVPTTDQRLGAIDRHGECNINTASDFVAQYTTRQEYRYAETLPEHDHEWLDFMHMRKQRTSVARKPDPEEEARTVRKQLECRALDQKPIAIGELRDILRRAAALLCRSNTDQSAIVHHLVSLPFAVFTKQSIKLGVSLWLGVINENPRMETKILSEIAENWERTVRGRLGIFNDELRHVDPFYLKEEFAPSDKETLLKRQQLVLNTIGPHFRVLQLLASHFNATRLGGHHIQAVFHRLLRITLDGLTHGTRHPLARETHFQIILFGLKVLRHSTRLDATSQWKLKHQLLSAALGWFDAPPRWSFGGNRLHIKAETHLLADVEAALRNVAHVGLETPSPNNAPNYPLEAKQDLLFMLLADEQTRLIVWLFPLDHDQRHHFASGRSTKGPTDHALAAVVRSAWSECPSLAVHLVNRFQSPRLASAVRGLLLNHPEKGIDESDALQLLLGSSIPEDVSSQLRFLLYWAPVNPITAVTYFMPAYGNHPYILQYAMRALESHPVDVTFFYVPQIVQTLRYDVLGYVERYIIETAKFSQLFAHQIIWNMKANAYKDEDSEIPDPVKPVLDKVMEALISSFAPADRAFYDREFSFFNEITDISGKLRPYIKRSKPEKKQKIEEELRKIKVEVGVYLPSNPEGVVIGIDRKSGKPLQSHAKAPYMATFRIRKNTGEMSGTESMLSQTNREGSMSLENTIEVWQSAIFKVGDDCRQDVLALQMIAAFRGIFNQVGLDVYVYPYRVTATAPGCGVIDVLPNSISRDMLGREAVNGLYDYFVSKYGGEDSIRFQEARTNFVKSMAAYSVISYLLQFKDRHNGNIMVDDAGHILHIDFGFCFDIAPGGVRFERAPFKLTSEMMAVMGGAAATSQPYHWFEELCIKAFLAARAHVEPLTHMVVLMLDSGLPCFKPETIANFRSRFVLDRDQHGAADYMRDLVRKAAGSYSTRGYDQFQLLTNGIPY
ncbi:MAG: phosphatidylinositol-4- kinase [Caeruleum heppii]|nr:MAG: phosphatidylinositol-4- kinase [Caeruleum heppii]